jgi:integrase
VDGDHRRWIVRVVRDGRKREFGAGAADRVSLAYARKKRDQILAQLADGLDPKAERQKVRDARDAERQARRKRPTFRNVAEMVITKQESGWRTAADGRQSSFVDWLRSLTKDCAAIAKKPIDEITTKDVIATLKPIWARGKHATARRLVTRIGAVLDYATVHDMRTGDNPAAWSLIKHVFPATPNGGKERHAALPWVEAPAFMARLREVDSTPARCVELAILTAKRSGEARLAKWSEINFDTATWTIPAHRKKASEAHDAPLSKQAIALLRRMETMRAGDLIFADHRGHCYLTDMMGQTVKRLAPEVTLHGFRTTARSFSADHGIERELAEMNLAHRIGSAVEAAYNRTQLLERRWPSMAMWADFLDGKDAANKVVPITVGRAR